MLQVDDLDVGLGERARDHAIKVQVLLAGHFLTIVIVGHAMRGCRRLVANRRIILLRADGIYGRLLLFAHADDHG